jgi:hypothetical protein
MYTGDVASAGTFASPGTWITGEFIFPVNSSASLRSETSVCTKRTSVRAYQPTIAGGWLDEVAAEGRPADGVPAAGVAGSDAPDLLAVAQPAVSSAVSDSIPTTRRTRRGWGVLLGAVTARNPSVGRS